MPIIKSAKKALRQTKRRESRNRFQKKELTMLIKKVTVDNLSTVISKIDKASKARLMSPQRASRIKSRLYKTLKPQNLTPRKTKPIAKKTSKTKPTSKAKQSATAKA